MRSIQSFVRFFNCCILFLVLLTVGTKAQEPDTVFKHLAKQMHLDEFAAPSADLFLHFDKTLYTPTESIWIAAYLLEDKTSELHHTLHVLLVNDMTGKAIKSENFVLEKGIGAGSFYLPDSLKTGAYSIIAYTNQFFNQYGEKFFRKGITVVGSQLPFKLLFSGEMQGDSVVVGTQILDPDGQMSPGASCEAQIYADGQPYFKLHQKTDVSGKIRFTLATSDLLKKLEIVGSIAKGKERMTFKYPVQWTSNLTYIHFYPGNGHLNAGHLNKLTFQLKATSGKGIAEHCVLLEDGKELTSFLSDEYGMGSIQFVPTAGKVYQVKIKDQPEVPVQVFPPVVNNQWAIYGKGLLTDSLDVEILSPAAGSECFVVVHNSKEMLYGTKIKLQGVSGRFRISTTNWPPGLATINILDNQKQLRCKKMILIGEKDSIRVVLTSDSAAYHKLSKTKVQVVLRDRENKPVQGLFSLTAISNQAFDQTTADIDRFNAYDRFLPQQSILPPAPYLKKAQNIENILYILENQPGESESVKGKPDTVSTAAHDGFVLYYEKPLKKPANLLLIGSSTSAVIATDARGNFTLPYEMLRGVQGSKIVLSLVAKNPAGYRIVPGQWQKRMDDSLARQYFMLNPFDNDGLTLEQKMILRSRSTKTLNEVTIKGIANRSKNYFGKADSNNVCDDYVCYLNFLNCKVHSRLARGSYIPEDGHKYNIEGLFGTEEVVYHCQFKGMKPYLKSLAATAYPTDFPFFNIADPSDSENLIRSTLFWQKNLLTDANGEAEVYFYTNEKRGDFLIQVQGIGAKGVFAKQISFKVKD